MKQIKSTNEFLATIEGHDRIYLIAPNDHTAAAVSAVVLRRVLLQKLGANFFVKFVSEEAIATVPMHLRAVFIWINSKEPKISTVKPSAVQCHIVRGHTVSSLIASENKVSEKDSDNVHNLVMNWTALADELCKDRLSALGKLIAILNTPRGASFLPGFKEVVSNNYVSTIVRKTDKKMAVDVIDALIETECVAPNGDIVKRLVSAHDVGNKRDVARLFDSLLSSTAIETACGDKAILVIHNGDQSESVMLGCRNYGFDLVVCVSFKGLTQKIEYRRGRQSRLTNDNVANGLGLANGASITDVNLEQLASKIAKL